MANTSQTPTTHLRQGHSMKGKDMLPVIRRVREIKASGPPPELASISKKYSLGTYSEAELKTEFSKLCGHDITEFLAICDVPDNMEGCRWAVHAAVLQANHAGEPSGQSLQSEQGRGKKQVWRQ